MAIEKTLRKLQRSVRLGEPNPDHAYFAVIPDDLAQDISLTLSSREEELRLTALAAIAGDLRFEHLTENEAKDAVWRFICMAHLERKPDHVPWFLSTYGRQAVATSCYFPLEHLVIDRRFRLPGVILMPPDDPEVPAGRLAAFPPPGSKDIVAVPTEGTSPKRMMQRARAVAEHALRVLRVGLREHRGIANEQLRFRLGTAYVLGTGAGGWGRAEDAPSEAGLDPQLERTLTAQPLAVLPAVPTNKAGRQAIVALRWLDRARLATDEVVRTLYNFFALEALLGDRSEGEKGFSLAFRRALLSLVTRGHFTDPGVTFFLYDEVRSGAVHGEDIPDIDSRELQHFDWNAREAMNEYLAVVQAHGLRKRSELIRYLESHQDAQRLLDWLRERDRRWEEYGLSGREKAS